MYPATADMPEGKLRLMYECNPLAFIVEVAGGKASDGRNRTLNIQPTELHERSQLFIGSKEMMEELESCVGYQNMNNEQTNHISKQPR